MASTPQTWFQAYCEQRHGELRQSSRQVYGAWWSRFCSFARELNTDLPDVGPALVQQFLHQYSANTAIRYYRLLSAVYQTAIDHEWCTQNPLASLQAEFDRKEDKVATPATNASTVETLYLIESSGSWKKYRDRMLVLLAAETGLHRAELLALRRDSLHLEAIPPYLSGTTNRAALRRIELPLRVANELRQWLAKRSEAQVQGELMFPTNLGGDALNPATAYRIIERYLNKVGAGKQAMGASGTQVLRAGLAVRSRGSGDAISNTQERLGHRRLLSTADLLSRAVPVPPK